MTGWIKCSDRLPEFFEFVLAYEDEDKNITKARMVEDGWINEFEEYLKCDVTHWMPLPELPQTL